MPQSNDTTGQSFPLSEQITATIVVAVVFAVILAVAAGALIFRQWWVFGVYFVFACWVFGLQALRDAAERES